MATFGGQVRGVPGWDKPHPGPTRGICLLRPMEYFRFLKRRLRTSEHSVTSCSPPWALRSFVIT